MNTNEKQEVTLDDLVSKITDIQEQLEGYTQSKNGKVNVKPLGKYHDIYLLIIGFTLTALVGGSISYFYQKKMYDYQKQAINYENKQHELSDFYKRVTDIITSRYLYANRLITSIEENKSKSVIDAQIEKYYMAVDDWSKGDAFNRAFILNNFEDSSVYTAYCSVAEAFTQKLHLSLRKVIENRKNLATADTVDMYIHLQDSVDRIFFTSCSKFIFEEKRK